MAQRDAKYTATLKLLGKNQIVKMERIRAMVRYGQALQERKLKFICSSFSAADGFWEAVTSRLECKLLVKGKCVI